MSIVHKLSFLPFLPDKGRVREVLRIATPLIIGSSALTVMQFCDRLFLARHSNISIQAALPQASSPSPSSASLRPRPVMQVLLWRNTTVQATGANVYM